MASSRRQANVLGSVSGSRIESGRISDFEVRYMQGLVLRFQSSSMPAQIAQKRQPQRKNQSAARRKIRVGAVSSISAGSYSWVIGLNPSLSRSVFTKSS